MNERGFSLIELLIVVAIVGVVSAIAVPSLLNARKAAYGANAVRYIKSWAPGQEMYRRVHGYYADNDEVLVTERFINKAINSGGNADDTAYLYSIDSQSTLPGGIPNNQSWYGTARRRNALLATNSYYIDQTGVIRVREGNNAFATDPPLD